MDGKTLFRDITPDIASASPRDFSSRDRTAVHTYIDNFFTNCESNDLFQKAKSLSASDTPNHEAVEVIDRLITEAFMDVSSKRTRRPPAYWFSAFNHLRRSEIVWTLFATRQRKKLDSSLLISQVQEVGILLDESMTSTQLKEKITEIRVDLKQIRKESEDN